MSPARSTRPGEPAPARPSPAWDPAPRRTTPADEPIYHLRGALPLPPDLALIPARRVLWRGREWSTQAYALGRTPVTNEEFARAVAEGAVLPPAWWLGRRPPADRADHPVTGVTLRAASTYAAWRGRRLPTSLEWLAALRPSPGRPFPWGTSCSPATCHCPRIGARSTAAVGAHPAGRTSDGVLDLMGNVWEWTDASPQLPTRDPGTRLVLGASFRHPCHLPDGDVPFSEVLEGSDYPYLGFRCAADVEVTR